MEPDVLYTGSLGAMVTLGPVEPGTWLDTSASPPWIPALRAFAAAVNLTPGVDGSAPPQISRTTAETSADCVLPGPFTSQAQEVDYPHWHLNADFIADLPPQKRM